MHDDPSLPLDIGAAYGVEHGLDLPTAQVWASLLEATLVLEDVASGLHEIGSVLPICTHLELLALRLEVLAACAEILPGAPNPSVYEDGLAELDAQREQLHAILEQLPASVSHRLFEIEARVEAAQRRVYIATGIIPPESEAEHSVTRTAVSLEIRKAFGDGPRIRLLMRLLSDPARS